MKKYIITVVAALSLGVFFSVYIFSNFSEEITNTVSKEINKIFIFQLGIFENEENANTLKESLPSAIVCKEDDLYKVYGAITKSSELISKIEKYYKENNINYIIKDYLLDNYEYEEVLSYENLMLQSTSMEVVFKTNQILLENFVLS